MATLLDIAPAAQKVAGVPVLGVSLHGLAYLSQKFPVFRDMLERRAIDVDALISTGPDAVCAIIAAGTGGQGDEAQEEAARRLPLETQVQFLSKILEATFPNGLAVFSQHLTNLTGVLGMEAAKTTAPEAPSETSAKRRRS